MNDPPPELSESARPVRPCGAQCWAETLTRAGSLKRLPRRRRWKRLSRHTGGCVSVNLRVGLLSPRPYHREVWAHNRGEQWENCFFSRTGSCRRWGDCPSKDKPGPRDDEGVACRGTSPVHASTPATSWLSHLGHDRCLTTPGPGARAPGTALCPEPTT